MQHDSRQNSDLILKLEQAGQDKQRALARLVALLSKMDVPISLEALRQIFQALSDEAR